MKGMETLRHYVHELQSQLYMAEHSPVTRRLVATIAGLSGPVLPQSLLWLREGVPARLWPKLWKFGM